MEPSTDKTAGPRRVTTPVEAETLLRNAALLWFNAWDTGDPELTPESAYAWLLQAGDILRGRSHDGDASSDRSAEIVWYADDRVQTSDGRIGRVLDPSDTYQPLAVGGLTVSVALDDDPGVFRFAPHELTRIGEQT